MVMPVTMYRDFRVSFSPTRVTTQRTMSLLEAIRMAVQGGLMASDVYERSPAPVREIVDGASLQAFQRKFPSLSADEQKSIFAVLLLAIENAGQIGNELPLRQARPQPQNRRQEPVQSKKWWQFWR
jgi:hypothetical protein